MNITSSPLLGGGGDDSEALEDPGGTCARLTFLPPQRALHLLFLKRESKEGEAEEDLIPLD